MSMSKTIIVADTGRWKNLFSTSGGISMPPVEAPVRMVMPSEMPTPKPAKMVFSTRSSVRTKSPTTCSHNARNTGLRMVLAMVVMAKRLPSTAQPSASMVILMTNSTPDTGGTSGDQARGHKKQHHRQRIQRVARDNGQRVEGDLLFV